MPAMACTMPRLQPRSSATTSRASARCRPAVSALHWPQSSSARLPSSCGRTQGQACCTGATADVPRSCGCHIPVQMSALPARRIYTRVRNTVYIERGGQQGRHRAQLLYTLSYPTPCVAAKGGMGAGSAQALLKRTPAATGCLRAGLRGNSLRAASCAPARPAAASWPPSRAAARPHRHSPAPRRMARLENRRRSGFFSTKTSVRLNNLTGAFTLLLIT